jgi:hypothetical protein
MECKKRQASGLGIGTGGNIERTRGAVVPAAIAARSGEEECTRLIESGDNVRPKAACPLKCKYAECRRDGPGSGSGDKGPAWKFLRNVRFTKKPVQQSRAC